MKTCLVVDDSKVIRKVARHILESIDYRVVEAADGAEALAKRPKVVFCTTENGMAYIRAAIDAGADEYVMKPFDRETLESKLQIVGLG